MFVCFFVYVFKDVSISEYTNTVEARCQGFQRFVITNVILMFRSVVNRSDESGRRPRVWQVGFLSLLLTRRSLSARCLFSYFTRRDCTSPTKYIHTRCFKQVFASYYNKRSSVIRDADLFSITGITEVIGNRIGGLR